MISDRTKSILNSITKKSEYVVHFATLQCTYPIDVACSMQYRGQIALNFFFLGQLMEKAGIPQESSGGAVPNVRIDSPHPLIPGT